MESKTVPVCKPVVRLSGQDGNAFAIIGACRKAWRGDGKDNTSFEPIKADMMSGDYDHLLQVALKHFTVL